MHVYYRKDNGRWGLVLNRDIENDKHYANVYIIKRLEASETFENILYKWIM